MWGTESKVNLPGNAWAPILEGFSADPATLFDEHNRMRAQRTGRFRGPVEPGAHPKPEPHADAAAADLLVRTGEPCDAPGCLPEKKV